MAQLRRRPDTQQAEPMELPGMGGPDPGGNIPGGGGFTYAANGGQPAQPNQGASASYGPSAPNGGPIRGQSPSPEAILGGSLTGPQPSPSQPMTPTPAASQPPVPNALPNPSPRAMTTLSGQAGGLLGGGLGVAGETGLDKAEPSALIALLSQLMSRG